MNLTSSIESQVKDVLNVNRCDVRFIFQFENDENLQFEIKAKGSIKTIVSHENKSIAAYLETFESDCLCPSGDSNGLVLENQLIHELNADELVDMEGWKEKYLEVLRKDLERLLFFQLENHIVEVCKPDPSKLKSIDVCSKLIA